MRTIRIKLYKFSELSKFSQVKAVYDHAIFLNEIDAQGRTFEDEETIEAIEANEYLFFEDGEMAHCTTYTGKHPKQGITEFHFHGKSYNITK